MPSPLLFGAIADDYTGASDLASMLREEGIRPVMVLGIQPDELIKELATSYNAIVIALKSRSIEAAKACEMSLKALSQLKKLNVRQIQFKYCSTFDSTSEGNIGPVTTSLMEAINTDFTVAIPSLPVNKRTQYMGYLFVGSQLISDSHMRHHPLNPMTEPNLVRHLQAQTKKRVGLIAYPVVKAGVEAISHEINRLRSENVEIALVDIISDDDLNTVAEAIADLPLITGGSGIAIKLPGVWRKKGLIEEGQSALKQRSSSKNHGVLILAGSCSAITLQQLKVFQQSHGEGLNVDVIKLVTDEREQEINRLRESIISMIKETGKALVYSSASPEKRQKLITSAQEMNIPASQLSALIEETMGELARYAVETNLVRNVIIAGGETSGAVIDALGIQALEIGSLIDPGVPYLHTIGNNPITLICKSGNFGSEDFFEKTCRTLL
jgi:3-dehydrotetronate 4-kinase